MSLGNKTMREAVNQHLSHIEQKKDNQKIKEDFVDEYQELLNRIAMDKSLDDMDKLDVIGSIALNLLIGLKAINSGFYELIVNQSVELDESDEFVMVTTKIGE